MDTNGHWILQELSIDSKIIDFIVRIYREDSTKIQLEKNKEIEMEVTSGIRQGCTASTVLFKLIIYKIIEEMRKKKKTEGIQILGPKITCLFYSDDGLILVKDKEKAERSIEIIREIGGKYGPQLPSHCILFNMKEKCEKISNIEVIEEIKYL